MAEISMDDIIVNIKVNAKNASKELDNLKNSFDKLKKSLNFVTLGLGFRKFTQKIMGFVNQSSKFISTMNHFNLVMGDARKEADKFVKTYSEILGLDPQNVMGAMASFKQMATGFGIASDAAYTMSKNLTQLSYDLAALGGEDVESVMTGLQSAFSGQSRALRKYGVDISRASLQQTAYRLGIEQTVGSMTKAQRSELIYYQIMTKTASAQTLYGKTLLIPATALATLRNQFTQLARAIGNIFIPILMAALPYIKALTQLLMEAAQAIANFFGFQLADYSVSISGIGGGLGALTDDVDDLGDAAGGTTKKLNKMLAPFDELNTIDFGDKDGSGGGIGGVGGGGSLGIPLYDYDALQGALKGANDKVQEIKENFKKMLPVVETIGALILAWKVSKALSTFIDTLRNNKLVEVMFGIALTITGIMLSWKGTQKMLDGDISIFSILETVLGTAMGTFGIVSILKGTGLGKNLNLGQQITIGFGFMIAIQGFQISAAGVDKQNVYMQVGGVLESALGGFLMGTAATGSWKIGLVVSFVVTVANITMQAFKSIDEALKPMADMLKGDTDNLLIDSRAIQENINNLKAQREEIEKNMNASLAQVEYSRSLVTELESLVDANGNVYDGYQDRVRFILKNLNNAYGTEYELVDGQIRENGKLVTSIDNIKNKIYELIQAKKSEIILRANEEVYANALKNRTQLYADMIKAQKNWQEATAQLSEYTTRGLEIPDEVINKVEEFKKVYDNATEAYKNNTRDIIYYEDLETAIISEDTDKINEAISNMTSVYETEEGKVNASLADRIRDSEAFSRNVKDIYGELGKEITEETKARLDAQTKTLAQSLAEQTKTVEDLTPDQKEAWEVLAQENYDIYSEIIKDMDPTLRQELQDMTGVVVEKTPEVERVTEELSTKMLDKLENNEEMRRNAVENVKAYLGGLSEPEQRRLLEQAGIKNADEVIAGLKQGNLAEDVGINVIKGLRTGLQNNYWQGQTLSTAFNFATNVLKKFKSTFGIQSPSKKTRGYGLYLLEGLGIGIDKGTNDVLDTVEKTSMDVLKEFQNSFNMSNINKKIGETIPEEISEGIIAKSDLVSDSFNNLINEASKANDLIKSNSDISEEMNVNYDDINKKITYDGKMQTDINSSGFADKVGKYCYDAIVKGFNDNPNQVEVNIGNEKIYSGISSYINKRSNKYGTNIITV